MSYPDGFRWSRGFKLERADGATRQIGSVITDRWFEMCAPGSPGELEFVLDVVVREFGPLAWRGQADISWGLHSALWRRLETARKEFGLDPRVSEPLVRDAERRLMARARGRGHATDESGRSLADVELLAKLQHHDAATRLLDCTTDPLIAAWFASREHPDSWGLLAGWDLRFAHELSSSDAERPIEELVDDFGTDAPVLWRPPDRSDFSERIRAQHAVFLFSTVLQTAGNRISVVTSGEPLWGVGNRPGVVLVALSPRLKADLLMYLELCGVNEEHLFPDFDGFGQSHGAGRSFPAGFWEQDIAGAKQSSLV